MKRTKPRDHSLFLKVFRAYLQYVNSGLYFRKEHIIGLENVPANGTPIIVVSNHQNCLNDPLCVCLQLTDRRMNFIARGNIFANPIINKVLRAFGMLPAYRLGFEGMASLSKNQATFDDAGKALNDGETIVLYPEADHQNKRWLGRFRLGYLRIAFAAAESAGFEQDIMILPSCNHYSNYFHARIDMILKFGKPISLKPYYEKYKQAPRETMVEINNMVREEVKGMMLNIEDLENYEQIEFLRENEYGKKFAEDRGYKPEYLPSRLLSDQILVSKLAKAKEEKPEEMAEIYKDIHTLNKGLKQLNIRDWLFKRNPGKGVAVLKGLGLLLLLPLFIASIIPTGLMFLIPKIFLKIMIKDKMFTSSFNVAVSALVSIPICLITPVILLWTMVGFWWALGYFLGFPVMFVLAWNYFRLLRKFIGTCNYVSGRNKGKVEELRELRKSVYGRLDAIIG